MEYLSQLGSVNSIEIERQVLGALLNNPEEIALYGQASPGIFQDSSHRRIFRQIQIMHEDQQIPQLNSLALHLEEAGILADVGGCSKLAELAACQPVNWYLKTQVKQLESLLDKRRVHELLNDVDSMSSVELIERLSSLTANLTKNKTSFIDGVRDQILKASREREPRVHYSQIAGKTGIPQHLIENWATDLVKTAELDPEHDLIEQDYNSLIEDIRRIEQTFDGGLKNYKLQQLARRHKRSKAEIMECYNTSLLVQQLPPWKSLAQIYDEYSNAREWLLRGFIPKSALILFHAQGGVGKTLFIQHLMRLIATGEPWDEYSIEGDNRQILYIQTDTSGMFMAESLRQANLTNDLPIQIHESWAIEHIGSLHQKLKEVKPVLVVIDSLTSVSRNLTLSENDTAYARPVLQMRQMAAEFGCSFVLIHHSNGEGGARGTKAIRNAVDEVWKLDLKDQNNPSNPERVLIQEKSRSRCPMRYKLKFNEEDFSWENFGPVQQTSLTDEEEKSLKPNKPARWLIMDLLRSNPGIGYEAKVLSEETRVPEATCRRELPMLWKEGQIERRRNQNYVSNQAGTPRNLYFL